MNEFICEVELPGWSDDKPFCAKLRRPSLLDMAASGHTPNELMASARRLFCEGCDAQLPLDELGRLLCSVAQKALVEPSYAQLEEMRCNLTDMQLMAIYGFAQSGVRALECFRP